MAHRQPVRTIGFGRDKCYTDYDALRKALTVVRTVATPITGKDADDRPNPV